MGIRLGIRSLQGPTNSTSSTVGIRLGVRSLQGPTNSTSSTVGIITGPDSGVVRRFPTVQAALCAG